MEEGKYIIALEIGSSKVKGAVGVIDQTGTLAIQAIEEEPLLDQMHYGLIRNVAGVSSSTLRIIRKLENRISPRKIESVYVAIGGRSFCSMPREAEQHLGAPVEISREMIEQLKQQVLATFSITDKEILKVVPREFIVDRVRAEHPIGTLGSHIRMMANVITCRKEIKRNLEISINDKLGLKINDFIVRQIAEADFVLTPDEKRLGCMLVDFGAETTTVSIYKHGRMQYMATLPLGSRNITRDLTHLHQTEEQAEEMKKRHGNALRVQHDQNSTDGVDLSEMNHYVASRAGEIIANIIQQIKLAGLTANELPSGIIIVGKGAKLNGFNQRLSEESKLKVRSGSVTNGIVRISDSRISSSDSVDIISTLYAVSRMDPVECLTQLEPEPEPEPIISEPEPEPEPEPAPAPKPAKKRWMDSLRQNIVKLMSDPDPDELDDELTDDEDN